MDNGEVELDSTPTSYDTEERRSRADESRAEHPFDNIVGESRALRDAHPARELSDLCPAVDREGRTPRQLLRTSSRGGGRHEDDACDVRDRRANRPPG